MDLDSSGINNEIKLDDFQKDLARQVLDQLQDCGQSGLEVMTSGGKSFIAAYVMYEYINKHHDTMILWVAPKVAINNVKNKIFKNKTVGNRIVYAGYEELARGNYTLCGVEESDIGLIVFDECHKALAKQTFVHLSALLEKLKHSDRLAMSATPVRYGGLDTFSVLVPKIAEPVRFDINDAAEHDLLPNLSYVLGNTKICASDFNVVRRYKDLVKTSIEAEELYAEVVSTLKSFQFDLQTDLQEILLDNMKSDGSGGERHIAFFRSIASLQEMRPAIESAFKGAYPNCTINILEYHSGLTDADNQKSFMQFVVDEPEDKRIDVMLSVDKATESIHPDNIRSVFMFRGTNSARVYLQQLGRGLMLKSYHPGDIIVYDFAENVSCLNSQSIFIGKHKTTDRVSAPGDSDIQTVDEIKQAIMRKFGYQKGLGLTTKLGIKRIQECVDKLREIERLADISQLRSGINYIRKVYKWMVDKHGASETSNIHEMIHNIEQDLSLGDIKLKQIYKGDEDTFNKTWKNIKSNFVTYQKVFLSDGIDLSDKLTEYFDTLGHSAYLTPMNRTLAESILSDIDYIKQEVDKCGSIESSSNTHAKHKLKQIRLKYAKGSVPYGICIYARRKGINIESNGITLQDIMSLCDTDKEKDVVVAYRPVVKALTALEVILNASKPFNYADWLSAIAKFTVINRQHRGSETGIMCSNYIMNTFGDIVRAYKLPQTEVEQGNKLISAAFKIINGEKPNKVEEDYIFLHSGASDMSDYELQLLRELGIGKREYSDKLEAQTEFMQQYEAAMDGDTEAIKAMLGYNRDKLDARRKKLLNTTAFKQIRSDTKDTLGAEVLLKTAKLMFERDGDYKKQCVRFNEALKDGTISSLDIALACFKSHEEDMARRVITCSSDEFKEMVESDQVNDLSVLVSRCKETASCSRDIMENILKISQLDSDIKTRLRQICQQVDIM